MTDHVRSTKLCLVKSASAAKCLERAQSELELARAVPGPYNAQMQSMDKTCKSRVNPLVIRKADYFKNLAMMRK